MAEARSAASEPRVNYLQEGVDPGRDFVREWRRSILRRFFRTRNLIRNGMWPTSIWNLGLTVGVLSVCLIGDWSFVKPLNKQLWRLADFLHIHSGIPYYIQILFVTAAAGFLFFLLLLYVRRYTLRLLLAYRGWMYEPPRHQSFSTILWSIAVRMWSGYSPSMYSCQASLPRMPVPPLRATLDKLLQSLEPLYGEDSDKMKDLRQQSQVFEKKCGKRLQRLLMLKSWWAENYVTDWWDKYVYLMGRAPIAINSNYYVLDHCYWQPTHRQCSRAAVVTNDFMTFKRHLDREDIQPLRIRGTIPLCMWQYERIFSTTRLPGEDVDEMVTFDDSKHIVVIRKGMYYKLDLYDNKGEPLTTGSIEQQFEWIIEDADKHQDDITMGQRHLPAVTGLPRTDWFRIRSTFFKDGPNKDALDLIEKSVFVVILSEVKFDNFTDRGKYLLHGDGATFWFDKSVCLHFFSDGKFGMNCEHAWGDAPVMGHVGEYSMTNELLEKYYTEDGYAMPDKVQQKGKFGNPQQLIFDIPERSILATKVENAFLENVKKNDDLVLCVREHTSYGKGLVKDIKVSPDAYIQLALQLAYYRDVGKLPLVYESSMTRLYLQGRTETVRSLSKYSAAFIRAMTDERSEITDAEKRSLLRRACDHHQLLYRDCMNGAGIDRHLFALYVACKGLGYDSKPECEFLKEALMIPWTLSTSQQPQQQISGMPDCSLPYYQNKVCPGGGFGPVSDMGYGVSYMIPGDHRFFFHVSCKKSSGITDSARFMDLLFKSFTDIRLLFNMPESPKFDARGRPILNSQ